MLVQTKCQLIVKETTVVPEK